MIEINNQTKSKINNNLIKETVLGFLKYFKVKKGEVSIAFIGDAKMRKLNKIYRGCDKTTDILSFSEEENKTYLGEVLINYNQIKRQAKKYSSSIKEELLFILVHGLLHLLGYEDDTEKGREKMNALADNFFKNIKLSR